MRWWSTALGVLFAPPDTHPTSHAIAIETSNLRTTTSLDTP
jgi:hypothetical protein